MIANSYLRNARRRIGLWPVAAFDHPDGRLRGSFDAQHKTLDRVLRQSFAGIADRPSADELYRWLVAPARTPAQRAWAVDVLKCMAVRPPQLVALVREDALSTYDLAVLVAEADCDYGLLTGWLNQYALPTSGPRSAAAHPGWRGGKSASPYRP